MALTDWVFPEMGYTRKQDKRALYENMIAPVYSGVTDNRSRVAEEYVTFLPHSCIARKNKVAIRKGITHMRPCLKARDINKDIKGQLPVIDEVTFREHFCAECPYYAGRIDKKARCMQRHCAWDDENEIFSPVLKSMVPILEAEFKKAEEKYLEAKYRRDVIHKMFADELLQDQKKKDPCYRCAYNSHAPCIGFCYKQMTSNPVDPAEAEMI